MFACVLGFVLFKRFYRDIGDIFFMFVSIGTIFSAYYNQLSLKKDPVIITLCLSPIIPILSWTNSKLQIPGLAQETPSPFFFYDFFFFWFIAYWTKGNNKRIAAILFTYCLSVIGIYISHSADFFGELSSGFHGARIDFNVVNAQYTSLFAGFGLIAATFLFIVKINFDSKKEALKKTISLALFGFFALIVIITQSRQVWLALVICLLLLPLAQMLMSSSGVSKRAVLITYLVMAVFITALSSLEIVKNRIADEKPTLVQLLNMEFKTLSDDSSIGLRIQLWQEGWEWIKQRPILGSGEDARELVIKKADSLPATVRASFTHLHNSHIETVLSFGLLGAALVYFLMLWPPVSVVACSAPPVKKTWRAFAFIIAIFWLTVNGFESYFYSSDGIYNFSVFYGVIYSFRFLPSQAHKDPYQEELRKKYFCQT